MILRTLSHLEKPALLAFYKDLPCLDRQLRFCGIMKDENLERYISALDFDKTRVMGMFDDDAHLVGVLELAIVDADAELAITLAASHKGQGLGKVLFKEGIELARMASAKRLTLYTLSHNKPMRVLARQAGMALHEDIGEIEAVLDLEDPSLPERLNWTLNAMQAQHQFAVASTLQAHRRSLLRWLTPWTWGSKDTRQTV